MAEDIPNKTDWTPWGEGFRSYTFLQVPHGMVLMLRRAGYQHAHILVLMEAMTLVRPGENGTRIRFTRGDLAEKVGCSKVTVSETLRRANAHGFKCVRDGGPRRTASDYNVQQFITWLEGQRLIQEVQVGNQE